jgi:hypothetical protein
MGNLLDANEEDRQWRTKSGKPLKTKESNKKAIIDFFGAIKQDDPSTWSLLQNLQKDSHQMQLQSDCMQHELRPLTLQHGLLWQIGQDASFPSMCMTSSESPFITNDQEEMLIKCIAFYFSLLLLLWISTHQTLKHIQIYSNTFQYQFQLI